jgi:hypothetical protein
MSETRFSNRQVDRKLCKECKKILKNNDITNLKDFRKWALKNHPDKGGDSEIFGIVSGCNDEYFGTNKRCDMDMNYSGYGYSKKPKKSRKPRKSTKPPSKEQKPCNSDQIRNPKTGRCVLKRSPLGKKIMKEMGGGSSRRASSRRASSRRASSRRASSRRASSRRASSAKKGRKACNSDQIRNPKTGRCVLKRSPLGQKIMKEKKGSRKSSSRRRSYGTSHRASSPSFKCKKNQILNPKTGRCVLKSGKIGQEILNKKKNK